MARIEGRDLMSGFVGALLAAIIAVPGSLWVGRSLATEADERGNPGRVVIAPLSAPRSFVGRAVVVRGEAEIPRTADLQLWIVVRVDVNSVSTYFPQGRAHVDDDGQWRCVVTLGSISATDDGPYAVKAELVDGATANRYSRYARHELATDGNGMEEYDPEKVRRLDMISLQRDVRLPSETKKAIGTCT